MRSPSASPGPVRVLVADSTQMQSQLLTSALRRRPEFSVTSCAMDSEAVLRVLSSTHIDVAVMTTDRRGDCGRDLAVIRRVHLAHPKVANVLLVDSYDPDLVISAFRSGIRGIFCFADTPFGALCKCIRSVYQGQVWANSQQLQYLLETITHVPSLRVVTVKGRQLLTQREEQVVALVADGLSNREIAHELGLSQHTIKKYLFRVFDKLGISSRVELVLYAMANGNSRQAEWIAGSA